MAHSYFSASVRFGERSLARHLAQGLQQLGLRRIALIVDEVAYENCGAKPIIVATLQGMSVAEFSQFEVNPKLADVELGVDFYRRFQPDGIIALGGGSAIDMGKLIGVFGPETHTPRELIASSQLTGKHVPLIAIPTTAGTGSEATHFAVVYVDGKKRSIAHESMLPTLSIVDPTLTASLPPHITATSGLDALCQAIESIWSIDACPESIHVAAKAIELANAYLEIAVNAPTPDARRAMSEAAYLSGVAINVTKTTAPHALSYALTTHHRVPHGAAVALTVSEFLRYNSEVDASNCSDARGPDAVRERIAMIVKLLQARDIDRACQRLQSLIENIRCPTRLGQVGVVTSAVPRLAAEVNYERLGNNPRQVDAAAIQRLLSRIL